MDKQTINKDAFRDPALRRKARQEAKTKFEERSVCYTIWGCPYLLTSYCKS